MRLKTLQNSGGFSFIELLTIMAIMGILTAIAMIFFLDTVRRARDTTARADAANMIIIIYEHYATFENTVDLEAFSGGWRTGQIGAPTIYTLGDDVEVLLGCENKTSSWDTGTFQGTFRAKHGTPGVDFTVYIDEQTGLTQVTW